MRDSKLVELSKTFALDVVKFYKELSEKEYVLSKQLLRCGTSIGANIHEVYYAQSKDDFVSKLKIALKESNETDYWLDILFGSNYITTNSYDKLKNDCGVIRRMLIASCNTINNGQKENKK